MDDWKPTDDLTGPLLDTLGAIVVILDPEGNIRDFNKACADLIGYKLDQVRDANVWEQLVPKDEIAGVQAVFAELLKGRTSNRHTNHWITRDGSKRLIAWSNSAVCAPDGSVRAVIGTGIDITEQKKAEAALDERQAALSAILQTAVDAIITIDQEGIVRTVNPAVQTLFGYDAGEIVGRNVKMLMPEPYRSQHDGYMTHYLKTGARKIIGIGREVTGRRKDGSTFPMHLAVSEFSFDGQRRFTGIIHDISQRKETEQLNTRLGRIVEESVNEIFVFHADTLEFLQVNRGALENLGYSHEEVLGLTPMDLLPDYNERRFKAILDPLREGTETQVKLEAVHRRKDGTTYDIIVRLQLMKGETPPVFIAIVADITERKLQNERLRQAQKMEAIGQLTGGIAHDFNNLLTVIVGNLEMLGAAIEDEGRRVMIEQALEAAELGSDLTGRLLAFARRQRLEPKTVDLNDLVLETIDLLRRTLGETIRIKTDLGRKLWPVRADPGQLQNALLNLAINARDAMPDGGDLTVKTANATSSDRTVGSTESRAAGRYVCLSVTDVGEGMSHNVREHAFEPFFTTKPTGSGTGLGLSMVYGFAKQSGGEAVIESELGVGTTVRVFLPAVSRQHKPAPSAVRAQMPARGGSEHILLVEDDRRVRQVTARRLERLGYRIAEASGAAEAVTLLRKTSDFDLLITDVVMPGKMNGSDLAIEARYLRPDIKIILTSGYANPGSLEATSAITEARFLAKPYKEAELAAAIRDALDA